MKFKNDYKTTVIKVVCYCYDRHLDQWNRTENPEINSYVQSLSSLDTKIIQWTKRVLSTNGARTNGYLHAKQ